MMLCCAMIGMLRQRTFVDLRNGLLQSSDQRGLVEMIELEEIDAFIAAALKPQSCPSASPWPSGWDAASAVEAVRARIDYHGVAAVLGEQWRELSDWPVQLIEWIREESRAQAFWEESHRATFATLIGRLDDAGIASLVLKGTALAYSVYEIPALRRRGDTDLMIRKCQLEETRAILRDIGFQPDQSHLTQEDWSFDTGVGFIHYLDLHWEFSNSPVLNQIFTVDELFDESAEPNTYLPRLHPAAKAVAPVNLFIHCSVNQAWHRNNGYYVGDDLIAGSDRLLWARDSHLLASTFSERQWQDLIRLCDSKNIAPLCLDALRAASRHFDTILPQGILAELGRTPRDTGLVRYVQGTEKSRRFAADLKASRGLAARCRYLLRQVFPPAQHMRERFPDSVATPLPILYLRRMAAAPYRFLSRTAG